LLREIKSKINTWENEVYSETPYLGIKLDQKAWNLIGFEEIIYWCEGNSISRGFGPSPVSKNNNEIKFVIKKLMFFDLLENQ